MGPRFISFFCPHKLNGLLACQVFYRHLQHTQRTPLPVNDGLAAGFGILRHIFQGQLFNGLSLFLLILDDSDCPKHNDTPKVGRIFFWNHVIFVNDTERCLAVSFDCIQLMTSFGTMKIDVRTIIHIADRDCIGVAVIP